MVAQTKAVEGEGILLLMEVVEVLQVPHQEEVVRLR
jgi:hypothetical protein